MTDDREYYDDELQMCRDCLLPECNSKYCYRVTAMIRKDNIKPKREAQESNGAVYEVAGFLFTNNDMED